jgi:hypothetical protein
MQILLAAYVTVNRTENPNNYLHPLVLAVTKRRKDATRLLMEAGASLRAAERYDAPNGDTKRSLVARALKSNDLPMCRIVLAKRAEAGSQLIQDYHSSQLWEHVKHNDIETVALLLQSGARANDPHEDLPNSALG